MHFISGNALFSFVISNYPGPPRVAAVPWPQPLASSVLHPRKTHPQNISIFDIFHTEAEDASLPGGGGITVRIECPAPCYTVTVPSARHG